MARQPKKSLSAKAFDRTEASVLAFERGQGIPPAAKSSKEDRSPQSVLVGTLLENLDSEGTADVAVMRLEQTTEIQRVYLEGEPTGGTFRLEFGGDFTGDIPWDATAEELQAELEALESIGTENVLVTLGKTDDHNPGVWLVRFFGELVGNTEMLGGDHELVGAAIVVKAETVWIDTGKVETVRSVIPVGDPTPQRAGAVVIALPISGAGYCVISVEPRDFNPYEL